MRLFDIRRVIDAETGRQGYVAGELRDFPDDMPLFETREEAEQALTDAYAPATDTEGTGYSERLTESEAACENLAVFVAQPMRGKSYETVMGERELIAKMLPAEWDIIDNIYHGQKSNDDSFRYVCLGHSIQCMGGADILVAMPDWNNAPGCRAEVEAWADDFWTLDMNKPQLIKTGVGNTAPVDIDPEIWAKFVG